MPMPWTHWARAAARNETSAAARNETSAAARKETSATAHVEQPALEKTRRTKFGCSYRFPHARPRYASEPARRNTTESERRHQPLYPRIDPQELAEIRDDFDRIDRELKRIKRDTAWNAVIDDAIRVCRLLAKVEEAEARKYRSDQPRVPAGNPDGGQWVDDGGEGGASAAAANAGLAAVGGLSEGSAATLSQQLDRVLAFGRQLAGRIVGPTAIAATETALAVGVGMLMVTAGPLGGARAERTETLDDGTVVSVSRDDSETDTDVRAVSPDGTITTAKIFIDADGSAKVRSAGVELPDGRTRDLDPAALTVAATAVINAATGGSGGDKTKPSSPDGTAATPPPDDEDPDYTSKESRLPAHLRNKIDRIENQTAAGGSKGVRGSVSESEARRLGERFVGRGYSVTRGKYGEEILVCRNGLRQYRGPANKTGTDSLNAQPWSRRGRQVNFESRLKALGRWLNNVHLDVK